MARAARGGEAATVREVAPLPTPPAARRDEAAVSRFTEDFASALVEMGVPRMPARVFAALLTSDSGRLTAAELAARLQASPAAVSGGVRYLIQVGLARREGEPGSRRHYYRVPDNCWDEVIGIRDRLMSRWTGVLRDGVGILGADTPGRGQDRRVGALLRVRQLRVAARHRQVAGIPGGPRRRPRPGPLTGRPGAGGIPGSGGRDSRERIVQPRPDVGKTVVGQRLRRRRTWRVTRETSTR